MAYAQWVEIKVEPTGTDLQIKNAKANWGKFYQHPNKDKELSPAQINKLKITPANPVIIASCGRSDASAGTEGSFDLYAGEVKVAHYKWNCPWGSKTNSQALTPGTNEHYVTQVSGGNTDSGALGNVTLKVVHLH